MANKKIIIATGGTGGHIFPALALKKELEKHKHKVILTADERFSKYQSFDENNILILAASFANKSPIKLLKSMLVLFCGFIKALCLIHKEKPDVVIGFGGYATLPTMLAATGRTIILHEANTVIGKANRWLLWQAKYLTTGFKTIMGVPKKYKNKLIYTGNPIRDNIWALKPKRDELCLLVIGGSGGAKIFSKIIPEMIINLPVKIKIIQQAKEEDIASIKAQYKQAGITCEVKSFFDNMDEKLAQSSLAITRSGASTLAELIAVQLPAILLPLPNSADNHQYYNAKEMDDNGAAWLINQDNNVQSNLLKLVKQIIKNPKLLRNCSNNLLKQRIDATKKLVELIEEL